MRQDLYTFPASSLYPTEDLDHDKMEIFHVDKMIYIGLDERVLLKIGMLDVIIQFNLFHNSCSCDIILQPQSQL